MPQRGEGLDHLKKIAEGRGDKLEDVLNAIQKSLRTNELDVPVTPEKEPPRQIEVKPLTLPEIGSAFGFDHANPGVHRNDMILLNSIARKIEVDPSLITHLQREVESELDKEYAEKLEQEIAAGGSFDVPSGEEKKGLVEAEVLKRIKKFEKDILSRTDAAKLGEVLKLKEQANKQNKILITAPGGKSRSDRNSFVLEYTADSDNFIVHISHQEELLMTMKDKEQWLYEFDEPENVQAVSLHLSFFDNPEVQKRISVTDFTEDDFKNEVDEKLGSRLLVQDDIFQSESFDALKEQFAALVLKMKSPDMIKSGNYYFYFYNTLHSKVQKKDGKVNVYLPTRGKQMLDFFKQQGLDKVFGLEQQRQDQQQKVQQSQAEQREKKPPEPRVEPAPDMNDIKGSPGFMDLYKVHYKWLHSSEEGTWDSYGKTEEYAFGKQYTDRNEKRKVYQKLGRKIDAFEKDEYLHKRSIKIVLIPSSQNGYVRLEGGEFYLYMKVSSLDKDAATLIGFIKEDMMKAEEANNEARRMSQND